MEKCTDLRCFRVLNVQWFPPSGSGRAGRMPPVRNAVRSEPTGAETEASCCFCFDQHCLLQQTALVPKSLHILDLPVNRLQPVLHKKLVRP